MSSDVSDAPEVSVKHESKFVYVVIRTGDLDPDDLVGVFTDPDVAREVRDLRNKADEDTFYHSEVKEELLDWATPAEYETVLRKEGDL